LGSQAPEASLGALESLPSFFNEDSEEFGRVLFPKRWVGAHHLGPSLPRCLARLRFELCLELKRKSLSVSDGWIIFTKSAEVS